MKNTYGGKRDNAGRHHTSDSLRKIQVGYRLPTWLVEWIRAQDKPASILIEQALIKCHKLNK